jgi:hypothetical protein
MYPALKEHSKLTWGYRRPALFSSEFRAWGNSILMCLCHQRSQSGCRKKTTRELYLSKRNGAILQERIYYPDSCHRLARIQVLGQHRGALLLFSGRENQAVPK